MLYILFERPDLLPLIEEYGGENLFCPAAAGMYREFAEIIRRCGKVESAEIPQEKSQMLADLLMEERYVTDQETTLRNCLWQLKQEQLDQEYRRLTQRVAELAEVDKLGATKEMQDALQKLDSIRRLKKEYETSRKGE